MTNLAPLANAIAIVTGGSGSLGRVIVDTLIAAGYFVVVFDSRPFPADHLILERKDAFDYRHVNVVDTDQVATAIDDVAERFQRIDILVHCAGILGPTGFLEDCDWPKLEAVLQVNLHGAITCSKALLPHMKRLGRGSIVFISSIAAQNGSAPAPVYSAAKAGLIGFARGLAKQVGRFQIRVNCISPGSVSGSELLKNARGYGLTSAGAAGLLARLPLARMVQAQEIADAVLYLCSDRARSITGMNMVIDAGESFRVD